MKTSVWSIGTIAWALTSGACLQGGSTGGGSAGEVAPAESLPEVVTDEEVQNLLDRGWTSHEASPVWTDYDEDGAEIHTMDVTLEPPPGVSALSAAFSISCKSNCAGQGLCSIAYGCLPNAAEMICSACSCGSSSPTHTCPGAPCTLCEKTVTVASE